MDTKQLSREELSEMLPRIGSYELALEVVVGNLKDRLMTLFPNVWVDKKGRGEHVKYLIREGPDSVRARTGLLKLLIGDHVEKRPVLAYGTYRRLPKDVGPIHRVLYVRRNDRSLVQVCDAAYKECGFESVHLEFLD